MTKEKIQTVVDSFVDYRGDEHKFMIAAVSIPEDDCDIVFYSDNFYDAKIPIAKSLRIGYAICHPNDEWDEELAYKMAVGRAKKARDNGIFVTHGGYINTNVVSSLLIKEALYLKANPGLYIKGYNEDQAKYLKAKKLQEETNILTDSQKSACRAFKNASKKAKKIMAKLIYGIK